MAKKYKPKKTLPRSKRKPIDIRQPVLPLKDGEDNPLQHLTLIGVRLISVQANVDIRGEGVPDRGKIQAQVSIGQSQQDNIHVDGRVRVLGKPKDAPDDEDSSSVSIDLHYQCVYRPEGVSAESLKDQAEKLAIPGMLVMWPHFRELVMSLTGRMGIPSLILPMFAVGPVGTGKGISMRLEDVTAK
jgi:hypothetical protein